MHTYLLELFDVACDERDGLRFEALALAADPHTTTNLYRSADMHIFENYFNYWYLVVRHYRAIALVVSL